MTREPRRQVKKIFFFASLCLFGIISFVIFSPIVKVYNSVDYSKNVVEQSSEKEPSSINADVDSHSSQKEKEKKSTNLINNDSKDEQVAEKTSDSEDLEESQSLTALYEMGIFPKKVINESFLKMVGPLYSNYVSKMSIFEKEHYNDEEAGDAIVTIRGKSNPEENEWESIIIYEIRGLQYAAYKEGDSIFYHSNDPDYQNKLPASIETWKKTFDNTTLEFLSE